MRFRTPLMHVAPREGRAHAPVAGDGLAGVPLSAAAGPLMDGQRIVTELRTREAAARVRDQTTRAPRLPRLVDLSLLHLPLFLLAGLILCLFVFTRDWGRVGSDRIDAAE